MFDIVFSIGGKTWFLWTAVIPKIIYYVSTQSNRYVPRYL